jgi:hypothetical protein
MTDRAVATHVFERREMRDIDILESRASSTAARFTGLRSRLVSSTEMMGATDMMVSMPAGQKVAPALNATCWDTVPVCYNLVSSTEVMGATDMMVSMPAGQKVAPALNATCWDTVLVCYNLVSSTEVMGATDMMVNMPAEDEEHSHRAKIAEHTGVTPFLLRQYLQRFRTKCQCSAGWSTALK